MKRVAPDLRRQSRISRRAFTAGLVLLFPGTGPRPRLLSLANAAPGISPSPTPADDLPDQDKIQGRWRIVHAEFSGRKVNQSVGVEDTISGPKWLRPDRKTGEYLLKLDPTKNPKWVDLSADRLGDQT